MNAKKEKKLEVVYNKWFTGILAGKLNPTI